MIDVYVSSALRDRSRAESVVRALELLGWKVWWHGNTPPDMTYKKALRRALWRSRCIIVLWSAESIESAWVRGEARSGVKRKVLVPVVLDPIEPPKGFRSARAVDFTGWDGSASSPAFRELASRLSVILGLPARGAVPGIALPQSFRSLVYPARWVAGGLIGAMLVGLGAWAKFHNDAEVGTDGFTGFRSSSQANSNAADLAAQKQQEEQDTKEGSVDKDNTVEQHGANAEPKPDDRDQASKEPREELESETRKARDEDPDRDAYETGRAAYRAGDYRAALGAFSDTVKHSPHGPYASKAQYWIADCWFELHDYRSAVAARQKFIADYPDNSKVPEAMLGLAAAYIELGDASNARKTLAVLIDRFPASQAAWRGHRLLVKLK